MRNGANWAVRRALQAVEAAVSAAVTDAETRTVEETASAGVAMKVGLPLELHRHAGLTRRCRNPHSLLT